MKLVEKTPFDSLVFLHSENIQVEEKSGGVLRLAFGPTEIFLGEDSARDFLYDLTAHFARKDLAELDGLDDSSFQESRDALAAIQRLRLPSN